MRRSFLSCSGEVTLLTDGKSRNAGWEFSTAGDPAAFGSTKRNGDDVDIYTIDPKPVLRDRDIHQGVSAEVVLSRR